MFTRFNFLLFILLAFTSCNLEKSSAPLPKLVYLDDSPEFYINEFFNSDIKGVAIILDIDDKIIDKIDIKSTGSWSGNKGTVKFEYIYKNNRKDYRTWLITKQDSDKFSIVGHDFVDSARGRQSGNVAEILYKMNYKFNGDEKKIKFVDNIYQINKNSIIVITELHHRGKKIGKIIASLSKDKKSEPKESKVESPALTHPTPETPKAKTL